MWPAEVEVGGEDRDRFFFPQDRNREGEEGDLSNAGYWYKRARRSAPAQSVTLDQEWRELATHFLAQR